MPNFDTDSLHAVALHHVGNKQSDEGYILGSHLLPLTEQLQTLLTTYFISPFKVEEYYRLYDEEDIANNKVYQQVQSIFEDPANLLPASGELARLLYDACLHPNIKNGDFFVVYFKDVMLNGETMDAVGLFKSENKEPFLQVQRNEETWNRQEGNHSASAEFQLETFRGININKLDKGALIFNTAADDGYMVSVVDATNRGADAAYWRDEFLHILQRQDEYYNTHEVMQVCKQFVAKELPQQFEVSKADQADLLNKSLSYFKDNDQFDLEDFGRDVLGHPEVIDSFNQYKQQYEEEHDVSLPETFDISENAVKRSERGLKSVIKLDKNFHIYVHGDRQLIEQGEDERGKFYKVYYNEES